MAQNGTEWHTSRILNPERRPVKRFAEVAVDAPVEHGRTFSYSIPPGTALEPGQLVRVPFGPRRLQGVVFSLEAQPQVSETKAVVGPVYAEPVLSEGLLRLARWISGYYMCSLFKAAALMVPPGGRVRPRTYYEADPDLPELDSLRLTRLQRRVLGYFVAKGRVSERQLVRAIGEAARASAHSLVNRGLVERSYGSAGKTVGPRLVTSLRLTTGPERAAADAPPSVANAPRQAALLERMLEGDGPVPLARANKEYGGAVNALIKKGWLAKESKQVERDPLAGRAIPPDHPVELTNEQLESSAAVRRAIEDPSVTPRSFLLHGVTGSGKTEVYLDSTARCLELGKQVIVLVPEIALTHQTVERFAARFPGKVAVLHSGLTPGERFDQWWKVARGEYPIVIGSRSAVFAPVTNLGLIVVDEEHEWTYKQHDTAPRYHARAVAHKRAALSGATVLLGSASPDVVSYYRASAGRSRMLMLPKRVTFGANGDGPQLPSVEVVDMRRELREGNRLIFSRALVEQMSRTIARDEQAILFLNRRGAASYLQCRNCGASMSCRRCDVSLTFHRNPSRLVCHYCGDRRKPPPKCPECLSFRLSYYGIGTQTVVDEVTKHFPGVGVLRWDRDTTARRGANEELLRSFRSKEAQVLVGTQMIAKGLHFPAVTLVGVVLADLGLHVPDYQAGERMFQVLHQVTGRAGRGRAEGAAIVQTYEPDNYAIRAAAAQDYQRFYTSEMMFRRQQGYPPLSRLARLVFSHANRAAAETEAIRLADLLRRERDAWGYSDVEVIGPTPTYPARVRGHYRWQITVRGRSPRAMLERVQIPHGWAVDVDPVGLP